MYYLLAYLLVGLVLLIVKSPVSEQVSRDVRKIETSYLAQYLTEGVEIPRFKIRLMRFLLSALLLFLYPLILYGSLKKQAAPKQNGQVAPQLSFCSDPTMFTKKVSVNEAEAAHMVIIKNKHIPFGYNNTQWQRLFSSMQGGDELWKFTSDSESWQMLAGREGIALVRDGEIVCEILTSMN